MRIRPAGSFFTLHESMERMVEVKSLQELKDHIKNVYEDTFNLDTLKCRFYCDDSRIGWHTYLITADFTDGTYKQQAILFADGPMEDLPAVVINAPLSIEPPKRRFILVKECDGKAATWTLTRNGSRPRSKRLKTALCSPVRCLKQGKKHSWL